MILQIWAQVYDCGYYRPYGGTCYCYMDMLSNRLLNIYAYSHRSVLLLILTRGTSSVTGSIYFCGGS